MTSKTYTAQADGFILGTFYRKGEPVSLTDAQAKYLAPPYGSDVLLASPPKLDKKDK